MARYAEIVDHPNSDREKGHGVVRATWRSRSMARRASTISANPEFGVPPILHKAFVGLQCGWPISRLLEQPGDLEHISRLEHRHPFLIGPLGQQLAIDLNRAGGVPSRRSQPERVHRVKSHCLPESTGSHTGY